MNADRLREAANRLDSESATYWDGARQEFVPIKSRQDDATAALLRAVADDIEEWRDRLEHWPEPITLGPPTRAWDAAVPLADAILGVES